VTQKGEEQNLETASSGYETEACINHFIQMLQIHMISPSKQHKLIRSPEQSLKPALCCKDFAASQFFHETDTFKFSYRQVTACFWKNNHKIKAGSDQCTVVLRTLDASMHEIG
jgi:hypothetical protein